MKFLGYHLANATSGTTKTVMSLYSNARGDHLEKTVTGAYRSLVAQLLEMVPDLDNVLDRLRFGRTTLPDSAFFEHAPIAVLQELFAGAVSQLGDRQIYCLLDALDETDEDDVLEMVDFPQSLRQGSTIMTCFASHHYPTLGIDSLQVVMDHEIGHANDIRRYIDAHLHVGTSTNNQIKTDLQARANGIFLWAVMAIASLNKEYRHGSAKSIQQQIHQTALFPSTAALFTIPRDMWPRRHPARRLRSLSLVATVCSQTSLP
ncbi:hypothetical protein AMS68_002097 [Peltaster fructicola]|uniref:Nephrocystin 3-like N-terminal domain-containing protein n=1 Tax=Peltaster fructicola TaxID=286661 RepID=A0A6H0XQ26_9PEZI|nr:hypothetical protein AMS68_002097 [Peltaster fructicola]